MAPVKFAAAVALATVVGLIFVIPPYFVYLATSGVITAIIVRSLGVVTGQAGLISLSHMAFAAIGAWVVSWMGIYAPQVPFLMALALGGCAGLLTGIVVGLPALRLRGLNLAAITLTFGVAVDAILTTTGFPGNELVVAFHPPDPFSEPRIFLVLCAVLWALISIGVTLLSRSQTGRSWAALSYSERATAAAGISVAAAKVTAFSISAAIAGIAGGLMAAQLGVITASNFSPLYSLSVFALSVFVGGRYWEGTILAGFMSVAVPELLRLFELPLDLEALVVTVGAIDALRKGSSLSQSFRQSLATRAQRRANPSGKPIKIAQKEQLLLPNDGDLTPARSIGGAQHCEKTATLEIADLTVRYGEVIAVNHLNMKLGPRTVMGLIGPNGAGKSTIVDAVTGFLPHATGTIRLEGANVIQLAAFRRARAGIRRTFQQGRAIPELTVGQYLRLSAGRSIDGRQIDSILEYLDCPSAGTPIGQVEIGLRRVVEIGACLAATPKVLLLDEPAAGLSAGQSQKLAEHIARIPKRFGCAVLLVEHDMDLVRFACGEITVLNFGKVIATGCPEKVLKEPHVVEAYLGGLSS
ncbi:branched-chain amino acid ABC transporter ATP-binding protein/permease [Bradyrhizobium japonicum]|uniref:branched-chain amino acid ABC transporter ATP-binding protein/permease n=1 Tax=Bradyrhizobium japonicum TaxID=375 RepID=UPI001BAE249C|nr:ATP-binding cassette domain-containing protein [Bradyrhizobium japonicum]MBR0911557.1 branched-chain amino acid ABC transporter ATP-binding protein/permease [Bradyrhizobium japonicum]